MKLEGKADIRYPTQWKFKLICRSETVIEPIVKKILDLQPHELQFSNESKKSNFVSYTLVMTVVDEQHRNSLYETLGTHPEILRVL